MRRLLAAAIDLYGLTLSPFLAGLGARCRFYPSCSQYAKQAVLKHGVLRGVVLAVGRTARCHPWNPGGIDLVP
jgi:putative membrane protein insertion efficiency factor